MSKTEIKTLAERKQKTLKDRLRTAIVTSVPEVTAQFSEVTWKFVYVPERHLRALAPDTMLVTGIRGAGKSFWSYLLQNDTYRTAVVGPSVSVSVGFGQGSDAKWPNRDELQQLLSRSYKPRLIWKAVLLRQIMPEDGSFTSWVISCSRWSTIPLM
jgi:hypothetical protein